MDLRRFALPALAVFLTVVAPPASARASEQSAVMATVAQFVDGYNKLDFKSASAVCASPAAIVDEFPPHVWMGANGCEDWAKAYVANAKATHVTDGTVSMGKPWQLQIDGDRAYVVLPVKFTWKQDGKPAMEPSSVWTLVLGKMSAGWRIMAWTWSEH